MGFFYNKQGLRKISRAGLLVCFLLSPLLAAGQSVRTAEHETVQNIVSSLAQKNIEAEVRPLLEEFGGFGSSVLVRPGRALGNSSTANAGTFVLAVPLDSGFAVETALAFIDGAAARSAAEAAENGASRFQHEILVAFLGDEKHELSDSPYTHKGLRDLLSLPDMPGTWALCYLDGEAAPDSLSIRHGAGDYIAPLELINPLPIFLDSAEIPFSLETRYNELYKLRLVRSRQELALLSAGEVAGFSLYAGKGGGHKEINARELARALLNYAGHLRLPLEELDQQYIIVSLAPGSVVFISEKTFVLFLTIGAALLLAGLLMYSVRHRVKLISRLFLFLRKGWIFFLFVPLMILIVLGSGIMYAFFHELFHVPLMNAGFWSSVLIIVLAVWFFYLLSTFLDFLHFSRKADLYGVSAIIIAAMGLLASAALDLAYVAIFLVAFLFSFIAGNSKRPRVVFVCALLIPLRALGALNNIRELGGMPIYMFIANGNSAGWMAAYQIAVLCLPVMLLLKRSMILFSQAKKEITFGKRFRHRIKIAPSIMRLFFLCLILAHMVINVRFFTDNPAQVRESFTATDRETFSVSLSQTVFQESRIVNVTLQARAAPLLYRLRLESEAGGAPREPPLVYSASVPFERLEDNSLQFILGEHPPNPLGLEIVVGEDFRGAFVGEAVYTKEDASLQAALETSLQDGEQTAAITEHETGDYRLTIYSEPAFLGEASAATTAAGATR